MELDADTIERLAQRVAGLLRDQSPEPAHPVRLVDATTLARLLGVDRAWVYRHSRQLGALRVGGPRGLLRFDLDRVLDPDGEMPRPAAGLERGRAAGRSSGLGVDRCSAYSRIRSTKSGRAARQRPRPDTGNHEHPMQNYRSAEGERH